LNYLTVLAGISTDITRRMLF